MREVTTLVLASLVAGLATTPYAAFHFHRLAPYGVLANLLAMPIVSAWVMPAGLLALVAMPFGFDSPLWGLMGTGIEWMDKIALWVASLPGAVGRIHAFSVAALLVASAGLFVICLLRTRLRFLGVGLVLIAIAMAASTPRSDLMVSPGADAVAVRGPSGRLSIISSRDSFAVREWLSADGDARAPKDSGLKDGFRCDSAGCIANLPDGTIVAAPATAQAVEEDCREANVVITTREAPPNCRALAIDRRSVRDSGAMTLRRSDNRWTVERALPVGTERPWARTQSRSAAAPGSTTPAGAEPTPRLDDLLPGD